MDQLPLISVIVPVYNGEKFIHECVDSVLNQTYQNIECILVDGDSPDRCPEICDQYALQDDRIKVIHKGNNGLSDDRNAGIKIARGEYLTFVDSDDYISKDMIRVLYEVCHKYHVLLSQCGFIRKGHFEEVIDCDIQASVLSKDQCFLNLCGQYGMTFCVSWGKLYHKSLFEYIAFPYGKTHEDVYTTHLFFEKAGKIGYITRCLYYYRVRDDSLVGKERKNPDLKELNSFIYRNKYFTEKGYNEAYKRHLLFCLDMIKEQYNKNYSLWTKSQRKYMKKKFRELLMDYVEMKNHTVSVDYWIFAGIPDLYYKILKYHQNVVKQKDRVRQDKYD